MGRAVSVDGICSIGVTATGGFNEQKLILPPLVVAQSLSVCLAQSASASVLAFDAAFASTHGGRETN